MTTQIRDSIQLEDGQRYALEVVPLCVLFKRLVQPPKFGPTISVNWRGYRACWIVADGFLHHEGGSFTGDSRREPDGTLVDVPYDPNDCLLEEALFAHDRQGAGMAAKIDDLRALPKDETGKYLASVKISKGFAPKDGIVHFDGLRGKTLRSLIGSPGAPVRATWYSGLLWMPAGESLGRGMRYWSEISSEAIVLLIDKGRVAEQWHLDLRAAHADEAVPKDIGGRWARLKRWVGRR